MDVLFSFTTYSCIYTVGCYKIILLIPFLNSFIILVLNLWLNFFFKQYLHHFSVNFWSWSKNVTFQTFFIMKICVETWPFNFETAWPWPFIYLLFYLLLPSVVNGSTWLGFMKHACTYVLFSDLDFYTF